MTYLRNWTVGRASRDLAIILIAVPVILEGLARSPRGCGMTPEFYAESLGLAILGVRAAFLALKWLNDALERIFSRKKSQPLDDL